jgi:hypothetical protein
MDKETHRVNQYKQKLTVSANCPGLGSIDEERKAREERVKRSWLVFRHLL